MVFVGVDGAEEILSVSLGVVAGGNEVGALRYGSFVEKFEFDLGVAHDVGVGGVAVLVLS